MKGCWPQLSFSDLFPKSRELRHPWTGKPIIPAGSRARIYLTGVAKTPCRLAGSARKTPVIILAKASDRSVPAPGDSAAGTDWPCDGRGKSQEKRSLKIVNRSHVSLRFSPKYGAIIGVGSRVPIFCHRVNFRDVSSRELHDNGLSFVGSVRRYEQVDAAGSCLGERVGQIGHFITSHFPAVRIR